MSRVSAADWISISVTVGHPWRVTFLQSGRARSCTGSLTLGSQAGSSIEQAHQTAG